MCVIQRPTYPIVHQTVLTALLWETHLSASVDLDIQENSARPS